MAKSPVVNSALLQVLSSVPKKSEKKSGIMRVKTLEDSIHGSISSTRSINSGSQQSLASDMSTKSSTKSSVGFKDIQIREYAIIPGDNPSCSWGPAISLDWEYSNSELRMKVEHYEKVRGERRAMAAMRMPKAERHSILFDKWDHSLSMIMESAKKKDTIRRQRLETARKVKRNMKLSDTFKRMLCIRI
eukprot:CAMPEP_0194073126 /NCGR_PEP_ID=MMETSP0149-20130528/659_1 /TAXON_ID=122233 /ORGANISM="Chaetoceros debilis, Strain MM31A-1" /LENGTH=188 /DNA_ID=CAMNT_0038753091 /DNA_START=140 /DNA_END=703 /DNA_ORIENTATION=+